METIIIKTKKDTSTKIKEFLQALKIPFEIKKEVKGEGYAPQFIEKIIKSRNEKSYKIVDPNNLWESLR